MEALHTCLKGGMMYISEGIVFISSLYCEKMQGWKRRFAYLPSHLYHSFLVCVPFFFDAPSQHLFAFFLMIFLSFVNNP